jgi:hypothetical protein
MGWYSLSSTSSSSKVATFRMLNCSRHRPKPSTSANWSDIRRLSHVTHAPSSSPGSLLPSLYIKNAEACSTKTMDLRTLRTAAAEEDFISMVINIDYT